MDGHGALFWYSFYTVLDFEFDPAKSVANREKHGIDFIDAQALWRDVHRIEVTARTTDETNIERRRGGPL